MSCQIIKFPATKVTPRVWTDTGHAEAFRDLEPKIADLYRMAEIACSHAHEASLAPQDIHKTDLAVFCAEACRKSILQFQMEYYKRWHSEVEDDDE